MTRDQVLDAIAESWASIDGRLEEYRMGRAGKTVTADRGGFHEGYLTEAEELLARAEARGVPVGKLWEPRG